MMGSGLDGFFLAPWFWFFLVADVVLRGFALWYSGRRGQKVWFIALLVVNTLGILPLIYLILNKNKKR